MAAIWIALGAVALVVLIVLAASVHVDTDTRVSGRRLS
jgi:hypothetical protein